MNNKHRKSLQELCTDPINGGMEWGRIEALLTGLGCRVIEGAGSSVTFERDSMRATFHRPHPNRQALRYRVKAARDYIERLGEQP